MLLVKCWPQQGLRGLADEVVDFGEFYFGFLVLGAALGSTPRFSPIQRCNGSLRISYLARLIDGLDHGPGIHLHFPLILSHFLLNARNRRLFKPVARRTNLYFLLSCFSLGFVARGGA